MDYWYLWAIFAVLCIVTVLVLRKASRALQSHNAEKERFFKEIERMKALKEEFQHADSEQVQNAEPGYLLEGLNTVLQHKIERAENPDACFAAMNAAQQYVYTLYYFLEDAAQGLSFFFKNNGEPLLHLASEALSAVGAQTLVPLVEDVYAMFDENNEAVSLDAAKLEEYDAQFAESCEKAEVLEQIKVYIQSNLQDLLV